MAASLIDRLQTPYRDFFLKKLSANFRPVGKIGQVTHGNFAFRYRCYLLGILLTEVNLKHEANHTIEISQQGQTDWASTGGTPASGTITGSVGFDEIDYAAAGLKTVTSTVASPPGRGVREVLVP